MKSGTIRMLLLTAWLSCSLASPLAQSDGQQAMPPGQALVQALRTSSLTMDGRPFHALLAIGDPGTPYSGQIEVWWVSPTKSKTVLTSPAFSQVRIVNGDRINESNTGDYYPRWLQNFADGLLNPVSMMTNFRSGNGAMSLSASGDGTCVRRDDRPGGITDQLTWGILCFSSAEPRLISIQMTNANLTFSDWSAFGDKQIAHTLTTDVLDYKPVAGHLGILEELKNPDDSIFTVAAATPAAEQIGTAFVSTLQEESMVEHAPKIEWPTVREGKTEGYMIVYARTDRTGQVRETSKHNSDQPGLESFGMEQALRYKFKPLLVNGVAVQMEMPLVLHFSSKVADPLPILSDTEMRTHISGCSIPSVRPGKPAMRVRVSVNEAGKYTGMTFLDANNPNNPHPAQTFFSFSSCKFKPLIVNGAPTYYHGDLLLP